MSNHSLLISTRKGLFVAEPAGAGYKLERGHFVGDNLSLAMVDPRDGAWYAALDHGHFGVKLHRSDDRGGTWTEIAVPVYPTQPEGEVQKNFFGLELKWTTQLIWSLAPALDAPGALWCGTIPGGLFRSEDKGASWKLVESLWFHPDRTKWGGGGRDHAGIHSICVDPRDPKTVAIAISTGGVWRTRDAGDTWTNTAGGMRAEYVPPELIRDGNSQDVHCLVQCAAQPTTFWAQHHNGIFVSTDDMQSWAELDVATTGAPSHFGFPVAVDPRDPNTAWFVPAIKDEKRYPSDGRVVVNRTRDGGKTFETLTAGLPQQHAYDLVYRHALDIDESGEVLAFGSTTGSLWVTENGGDSWQTVSSNLPPIHSVRFAGQ